VVLPTTQPLVVLLPELLLDPMVVPIPEVVPELLVAKPPLLLVAEWPEPEVVEVTWPLVEEGVPVLAPLEVLLPVLVPPVEACPEVEPRPPLEDEAEEDAVTVAPLPFPVPFSLAVRQMPLLQK
jgi:hypothetical protein